MLVLLNCSYKENSWLCFPHIILLSMKTRSFLNTQQFSWIPAGTQTATARDGQTLRRIVAVAKYPYLKHFRSISTFDTYGSFRMNIPLTSRQILSASLYTQLRHRNNPQKSPFMEQLEAHLEH